MNTKYEVKLYYFIENMYSSVCSYLNGHILDMGLGIGDFLIFRANTVSVDINEDTVRYCAYLD